MDTRLATTNIRIQCICRSVYIPPVVSHVHGHFVALSYVKFIKKLRHADISYCLEFPACSIAQSTCYVGLAAGM